MNDRDCPNCIRNIPGQGCTSWDCKYINRVDAIRVYEGINMAIDRKDEPNYSENPNNCEKDCFLCKWLGDVDVCGRCRNRNLFAEADTEQTISKMKQVDDESQTEPQTDCCDTCKHKDDGWDSEFCDPCSRAESHYEPRKYNGIGCSRCENRYDCYDRDMPHAVYCNNYGKITD